MPDKKNLDSFLNQIKEYENGHALDLSSSEDLSIAVMNLVSIEEHLFFTAGKTENRSYLELMSQVRQIRKSMQGHLVKDTEGEVWCICKHLLAASMRLIETGNKTIGKDQAKAYDFYDHAQQLYNLFWLLNLKLIKPLPNNSKELTDQPAEVKTDDVAGCKLKPFSKVLGEQLDCCKE